MELTQYTISLSTELRAYVKSSQLSSCTDIVVIVYCCVPSLCTVVVVYCCTVEQVVLPKLVK
jgi:hypothetical protein